MIEYTKGNYKRYLQNTDKMVFGNRPIFLLLNIGSLDTSMYCLGSSSMTHIYKYINNYTYISNIGDITGYG